MDQNDPELGYMHLDFYMKLPFELMLFFLAVITFIASLCIFFVGENSIKVRYYSALIGMISSFAIGTYLAIQVYEYTPIVSSFPQNIDILILLTPFYLSLQVGAAVGLLGTFPMMSFSFYTLYCKSERKTGQEGKTGKTGKDDVRDGKHGKDGKDGKDGKEAGWCLGVFLVNCTVQAICKPDLTQA